MRAVLAVTLGVVSGFAQAGELACDNGIVQATAENADTAAAICAASDAALAQLGRCDLPMPKAPLSIVTQEDLGDNCVGLFHCGESLIEILPPEKLSEKRSELGLFQALSDERLFESVIQHEIAHAVYDRTPCPIDTCIASSEYFAYVVQIMALTDPERDAVLADLDETVQIGRDVINPFVLFMAPDRFALLSWQHISQRGDRCAYLRQVVDGSIVFDREHP
ncbi:DUF6639 family protein [Aestuariicoccus sp. MJ-SS9]|uniref:DUF6639 family protein n=1 Tax=Aestuariicoccus sp. MJ-SS9 TaxID=3079855 RepID=UPI0029089E07|nr:DUF6639 family protein [Aestuariicoccus sp. MJ-SS9]MDU8913095.1 DUF6639 family protein [Aestuariicoccus sp. MJ-SS9]